MGHDDYDDPRVRWSQESLNQLGMDASGLYFNTVGERIISNGAIIGLLRLDGASSAGTEYTTAWKGMSNKWSSAQKGSHKGDRGSGKGKSVTGVELREDRVDPSRIVDKRLGLCRRCGQVGHDTYGYKSETCLVFLGVHCWECGMMGHHYKACMVLGLNWERGILAHPGHVSRLEEEHFG